MTTPDMDILLPFGVACSGNGLINVLDPSYIALGPGVHTIQVTWSESSRLRITLAPIMSNESRVEIADIPAGQGRRTAIIPGISVPEGDTRYISLLAQSTMPSTVEAAVQVVSVPLQPA